MINSAEKSNIRCTASNSYNHSKRTHQTHDIRAGIMRNNTTANTERHTRATRLRTTKINKIATTEPQTRATRSATMKAEELATTCDDAPPLDHSALLRLPDEMIAWIIREAVTTQPILIRGITTGRTTSLSTEVAILTNPFRANKRLWSIAMGEVYNANSFVQIVDPKVKMYSSRTRRRTHISRVTDTKYAKYVELQILLLTYQEHALKGVMARYGELDHGPDIERCAQRSEQLRALTVSIRHNSRMARTMHYYDEEGGPVWEALGYAKDVTARVWAVLTALDTYKLKRPGVKIYLLLIQVDDGAVHEAFEIDGRGGDIEVNLWEMMDYSKCRVRIA
ncbi:hypothetical protein B0A55_11897 [Friedmanniomyces simplex]|uniref:Uncharacterized protein n=1 Tax=Friedmanniomyces simplex TaxID=329884 RepID=A0A4U0W6W2_9PEZI|nr:hypothetical protein B0A55_11897 [Friedmanniomyces simplex]